MYTERLGTRRNRPASDVECTVDKYMHAVYGNGTNHKYAKETELEMNKQTNKQTDVEYHWQLL